MPRYFIAWSASPSGLNGARSILKLRGLAAGKKIGDAAVGKLRFVSPVPSEAPHGATRLGSYWVEHGVFSARTTVTQLILPATITLEPKPDIVPACLRCGRLRLDPLTREMSGVPCSDAPRSLYCFGSTVPHDAAD
jgi:hypothetical protein